MIIKGLQKLTLLDYPGKIACTIFTGGCNFRCPFCHNASLVIKDDGSSIFEDELFSFLKKRQGILEGVCVTGGEPLLHSDIDAFLKKIKELGFLIKLDTNGSKFEKLKSLIEQNLVDFVAMDIKNSIESYSKTIGINNFDITNIIKSVELLKSNIIDYEFRTTVVKELHTREDFEKIAVWLDGAKQLYLQSFVDSGDIIGTNLSACTKKELESFSNILKQHIEKVELRGV